MELCPLAQVRDRIRVGSPLPFCIRDAAARPLLAKHQVVNDERELQALVEGGAWVDIDELSDGGTGIAEVPPERLPALWRRLAQRLSDALSDMPAPGAPAALATLADDLEAFVEGAPDLAIFLLVRPEPGDATRYGVVRSLQAAAAACLIAQRLDWPRERRRTLVKAAFTMNLGMLDLQERLSNQARLPSPQQRHAIHVHPSTSVATLQASGVTDPAWLRAVAEHHEKPGGSGFPAGLVVVDEMASALRTVDLYTAKLAGRSGRDALPPPRAARDLLVEERGNPFALALITEFGVHPPGSLVRLHGGEVAVVVRRTADSDAPLVAVLLGRRGEPLDQPLLVEASGRDRGIAGSAQENAMRGARVSAERLYGLVT